MEERGAHTPSERSVIRSPISTSRVLSLLFSLQLRSQRRAIAYSRPRQPRGREGGAPFGECLLLDLDPLLLKRRHVGLCASGLPETAKAYR